MPVKPQDGLVAFASCVIEGALYLGSIAVYTRPDGGYRLVYPTKKIGDRNLPIHHPINRNTGEEIEEAVISRLRDVLHT